MRVVLSFCANFAPREKEDVAIVYFGISRASTVTGTYRFVFFIRIDGTDNATHVFNREGVTVTIDGEIWANKKKPEQYESYSVVSVKSKEFVVTKPTVQQCIITFDPSDGTGSMLTQVVAPDSSYTLPACTLQPPAGKKFKGWMVNGTEKAVGETITIDQDLTLTAVWQEQDLVNNPGNNLGANPQTPSPSPNPSATPHDTLTKAKRTTDKEKVAPKTGDSMILIVSGLALVATAGGMGLIRKKENE